MDYIIGALVSAVTVTVAVIAAWFKVKKIEKDKAKIETDKSLAIIEARRERLKNETIHMSDSELLDYISKRIESAEKH